MIGLNACKRQNRTTGAKAMIAQSVADIVNGHVKLSVEGIDRMYLNVYVPRLQREPGVVWFFREHRGQPLPSAALMRPISRGFVSALEDFAAQHEIPVVQFRKGRRKDQVMAEHLRHFRHDEGVVFVGKAQEKTTVFRTEKRRSPKTGQPYPWIVRSTAMVNHYYIYAVDRDFGPFFLKFCTYFPFNAKLCLNGHEYAKRQLACRGIAFEALDNGVLSCADPKRLQRICDGLCAEKIDALLRKWLRLLPHPFTGADRQAGYRYDISILQAEFSLTQVLDRPVHGRLFFEQVIRENLDLGRPDEVQLIFNRKITSRTPGRFRTRILTQDVTPSLNVYYKNTRIKQYHKENRLASVYAICRNCAKSVLRPTAACSRSSASVMTACWRKTPSRPSTARSQPVANAPPAYALPIRASTPCGMPSSCFACSRTASAVPICASILPACRAAFPKRSARAPSPISFVAYASTA